MFKNMKIPVENNLDEIVAELERLGYECEQFYFHVGDHREKFKFKSVACYYSGCFYHCVTEIADIFGCELTTLAELKEM